MFASRGSRITVVLAFAVMAATLHVAGAATVKTSKSASKTTSAISLPDALQVDNTGDAAVPTTVGQAEDAAWVPPAGALAAKRELFAFEYPYVARNLALAAVNPSFDSGSIVCPVFASGREIGAAGSATDCDPPPANYELASAPLDYQRKTYTCGPASTRLVLWQMTGSAAHDEDYYASKEHTTTDGTVANSIAKTLTNEQSRDTFILDVPDQPADYMTMLAGATYKEGHEIVNNVLTKPLSFWGAHASRHYDVSYGYRSAAGGYVYMVEEWNPVQFGISLQHYGGQNPYGHHYEPLKNVFAAVHTSTSQGVIW